MAGGLYDPFAPQSQSMSPTSPGYAQQAVQTTQQALQPQYKQAMAQENQSMANRGLNNSGMQARADNGVTSDYLHQLSGTAAQAAMQGANIAEQEKQAEAYRQWQQQMQQNALDQQNQQFKSNLALQTEMGKAQIGNDYASEGGSAVGGLIKAFA